LNQLLLLHVLLAAVLMSSNSLLAQRETKSLSPDSLGRIDAHAHLLKDAPAIYSLFDRLNLHILNICVVDNYEPGNEQAEPQHAMAIRISGHSQKRAA